MNDFEDRLSRLLNEDVDARLGEPRPAPPQRFGATNAPGRHAERRGRPRVRTRWLPPLIAAAVIVLALAGTAAAGELLSSPDRRVDPATVEPSASSPASGSTVPPTTSAPTTPPTTRPVVRPTTRSSTRPATRTTTEAPPPSNKRSSSSFRPRVTTVAFGTAILVLPAGWEARDLARYFPGSHGPPARCLTPKTTPVGNGGDSCPVTLTAYGSDNASLYADHDGAGLSDAQPCGRNQKSVATKSGRRQLGGRLATWHHWDYDCGTRPDSHSEQYVITTAPAYVLYSNHAADQATVEAMTTIATGSKLPS